MRFRVFSFSKVGGPRISAVMVIRDEDVEVWSWWAVEKGMRGKEQEGKRIKKGKEGQDKTMPDGTGRDGA